MADVTITYKNNEIATMNATGVKTLLTGDTFCEDDIVVSYTKPSAPSPTLQTKTATPSTSQQTITPDNGYDGLSSVTVNAMPSGSARTPATTITANPTISVSASGLITASNSKTQSVTPTVSAGYVSSGTAGTITVSGSNTQQLTTKSAQTYTPTTSNQTISSGRYLTGTQTIKGDANLIASNIKKNISIFGVTGTYEGSGSGGLSAKTITGEAGQATTPSSWDVDNFEFDPTVPKICCCMLTVEDLGVFLPCIYDTNESGLVEHERKPVFLGTTAMRPDYLEFAFVEFSCLFNVATGLVTSVELTRAEIYVGEELAMDIIAEGYDISWEITCIS